MKKTERHNRINTLAGLLLFGVFAACVLSVLLTGTGVYRRLSGRSAEAYDARTAVHYLATKVRQAPSGSAVSITEFEGVPALTLREIHDGIGYLTRIYCHEGCLKELFARESGDFVPADGEEILPVQGLSMALADDLLTLTVTPEMGEPISVTLLLRGEGAAK